jgi:hypothetical protein
LRRRHPAKLDILACDAVDFSGLPGYLHGSEREVHVTTDTGKAHNPANVDWYVLYVRLIVGAAIVLPVAVVLSLLFL